MTIYFNYQRFNHKSETLLIISCYHQLTACKTNFKWVANKLKEQITPAGEMISFDFNKNDLSANFKSKILADKKANGQEVTLDEGEQNYYDKLLQQEMQEFKEQFVGYLKTIQKYSNPSKIIFTGDMNLGFSAGSIMTEFLFDSTIHEVFSTTKQISRILESSTDGIVKDGFKYAEKMLSLDDVLLKIKEGNPPKGLHKVFGNFSFKNEFIMNTVSSGLKSSTLELKSSIELRIQEEQQEQAFKKIENSVLKEEMSEINYKLEQVILVATSLPEAIPQENFSKYGLEACENSSIANVTSHLQFFGSPNQKKGKLTGANLAEEELNNLRSVS